MDRAALEQLEQEIDAFVEAHRDRCLWFVARDGRQPGDDARRWALTEIQRRAHRDTFARGGSQYLVLTMHPPDIEAEVTFLPWTSGAGRRNPVRSGYRPVHRLRDDYWTSGTHTYLDAETVPPGGRALAHITFISPEAYPASLWLGRVIVISEGERIVAHARVTRIFNASLERPGGAGTEDA